MTAKNIFNFQVYVQLKMQNYIKLHVFHTYIHVDIQSQTVRIALY